jgi:hypothetical protein
MCSAAASNALADSISISVHPDPALATANVHITASGTAGGANPWVYVNWRPADSAGCAPGPDPGNPNDSIAIASQVASGAYSVSADMAFPPGRMLLCGWVVDNSETPSPVLASTSEILPVRTPEASLSLHVPARVTLGRRFVTRVSYQLQAGVGALLFVDLRPASGRACASTVGTEPATAARVIDGEPIGGQGTAEAAGHLAAYGTYRLCAWIESSFQDTQAIAGPVSARVVVAPAAGGTHFRGTTSQKLPISFMLNRHQLNAMNWTARYTCVGPQPTITTVQPTDLLPLHVGKNGIFIARFASGSDHGTISGRIRGHTATGKITESYALVSGNVCRIPTLTFMATSPRPKR